MFKNQTPAEIDTQMMTAAQAVATTELITGRMKLAITKAMEGSTTDWAKVTEFSQKAQGAMVGYWENLDLLEAVAAEFKARDGWTRFYLVNNTGGHVHSSRSCSSCYVTTEFTFLPEYSGTTEENLVELAGTRACTVCFPSAPVDTLRRPSNLRVDVEARERAAAEKAAKAAEKARTEAARLAKAGGALETPVKTKWSGTPKTVQQAKTALVDTLVEFKTRGHKGNQTVTLAYLKDAKALKAELVKVTDYAEVAKDVEKKAAAKLRKQEREAARMRITHPWMFQDEDQD